MKLIINSSWLEKNQLQFSSTIFPFIPHFSKFSSISSQIIPTVSHFSLYNLNHSQLLFEKVNRKELHHTTLKILLETPSSPNNETNDFFSFSEGKYFMTNNHDMENRVTTTHHFKYDHTFLPLINSFFPQP
jgi:hypothetical protein